MKLEFSTIAGALSLAIPEHNLKDYAQLDGKRCLVTIEEQNFKTLSQNSAFHSLIDCFWRSGCSSHASKEQIKAHYLIECEHIAYTAYVYFYEGEAYTTMNIADIPSGVMSAQVDYPASWAHISKKKAMQCITSIIRDMDESGVLGSHMGKKYGIILNGLMKEDWYK